MKTAENIKLKTVGKLISGLKRYEKNHWHYCIIAWTQDDRIFGVVGIGEDEDGDISVEVEEEEYDVYEGFWTVDDVIESLRMYNKDARVYLEGEGLYLSIDGEKSIFSKNDDEEVVDCYVTVIGEYEVVEEPAPTEQERERARRKEAHRKGVKGILIGTIFLLCIPLIGYGLYYNIAALVKHSLPVWQGILWIALLLFLLCICIKNLISPEHDE